MSEISEALDRARGEAAVRGINLQKGKRGETLRAARLAAEKAAEQQQGADFVRSKAQRSIKQAGLTVALILVNMILHVAPPLMLIGLAVMEQQRVSQGIAMFDPARAELMAWVTVMGYISLVGVRAHLVQTRGLREFNERPTLRRIVVRFLYWLGIYRKSEVVSEGEKLASVLFLSNVVVVLLGAAGSLSDDISAGGLAWYDGLVVQLTGTMDQVLALVGGASVTLILLRMTHYIVDYTYEKYVEAAGDLAVARVRDAGDRAELALVVRLLVNDEKRRKGLVPKETPYATSAVNSAENGDRLASQTVNTARRAAVLPRSGNGSEV